MKLYAACLHRGACAAAASGWTERFGWNVRRKITGYHQDEEGHWVAELECGHGQHVRHNPPWIQRPWVTTPEGRAAKLGTELNCRLCDLPDRP